MTDPIEAALDAFYGAPGVGKDAPDEIRADMSRAIAAYEAARWQDIASAPTDGTPILVGCARTKSLRWAVWSDGYWRDGQAHAGGEICGCPEPTHWQPLPAAPKGE